MRHTIAFILLWLVAGCGEVTWIVLEVDVSSALTEEIDELECEVRVPVTDGATLTSFEIPLAADDEFPMTILLEPEGDKPNPLRVQIDALHATVRVATVTFDVPWKANADNFPDRVVLE